MFTYLRLPTTLNDIMYGSVVKDVLRAYGIEYTAIYDHQKGYRNEIWPVRTVTDQMINVTFYKREDGIVGRIQRADAVSEYLVTRGMQTRQRFDTRILQVRNSDVSTSVGVYTYLPGKTIPWEAYTMAHLKLLGKTMSDMHALLAAMPNDPALPLVYDEYYAIIKRMYRYFSQSTVKSAMKQKLQLSIDTANIESHGSYLKECQLLPGQQALHMDFVRGNILFNGSEPTGDLVISGVLDFEKTAFGHPVMDIARTLAFLLVDCKYKAPEKTEKYFLYSGYQKRGSAKDIRDDLLRIGLVRLFLTYDFYKFLRHNPYESLHENEHYLRTRDILLEHNMIRCI